MGTAVGREGMKATGGTEGIEATGMGTGVVNGWEGGGVASRMGLACGARTDLETSSNHRSASDGVRLWEVMAGEDEGGTTITGVGDDQSPPVARKHENENVIHNRRQFVSYLRKNINKSSSH